MSFWQKLLGQNWKSPPKSAEDHYQVEITEKSITVNHPERPIEVIDWSEIEEIKLINTDEGPFLPDVWLTLTGNGKACSIPQGSEGWDKVYDIVSQYENFNFENVIRSTACTNNQTFELWKKYPSRASGITGQ